MIKPKLSAIYPPTHTLKKVEVNFLFLSPPTEIIKLLKM